MTDHLDFKVKDRSIVDASDMLGQKSSIRISHCLYKNGPGLLVIFIIKQLIVVVDLQDVVFHDHLHTRWLAMFDLDHIVLKHRLVSDLPFCT